MTADNRHRWIALVLLCMGSLMIVLDTTIVNVALPSIRADLGFSQTSLAWVVNAYMLTFGGFLLLGGGWAISSVTGACSSRGITLFTLASLACGLVELPGHAGRGARRSGSRRRDRLGGVAVADR